jgi:menaquinone-dependent protoporphyrinogen oxidase
MKVLVCAASKHGATTEIAAEIGAALAALGVETFVRAPDEVESLDGYDAAIIGSAVYVGHWLEPARQLVERHQEALRGMPTWLFSSGPVGNPPKPAEEPVEAQPLAALIGARDHRVFPGEVDRTRLGFGERAIVAAVRAPEGDFRPWVQIEAWSREIAGALQAVSGRS